jgi:colicin import membrane protein
MAKQPENNNSKGLIGTLVVHGLLILVFILYGLSVPLPLPAEKGIVINFGNTDMGSGDEFTNPNENVAEEEVQEEQVTTPPPPKPVTPTEEVVEEIITSADEEAPAIQPEKKKPQPKVEKKPEKKAEESQ